ncbi:MAG: polysaccharide deacetylase family protein [Candidatus Omnitrophota bacterium]
MRVFKRIFLVFLFILIFLFITTLIYVYNHYNVPILTYHSINNFYIGTPVVKSENFEKQVKYLHDHKYNVITLDELVDNIKNNKNMPRDTVVITFDDGFKDNYSNAYPILKKYKIPATIFLISNCIGNKSEYLTWQEINEMLKGGVFFGGHTKNHVYLPNVSLAVAYQEIKGSKEQIEANTGQVITMFSYPAGGFDNNIKKIVEKAGFKAACTTNRGYNKASCDIFELKRIKVTDKDAQNLLKFRMKISGYYDVFRRLKNPS